LRVSVEFPFRARHCDLVHINSTLDGRSILRDGALLLLSKIVRRPVLVQFHGGRPLTLGPVSRFMLRRFNHAQAIIFLTKWQMEEAASLGLRRGALISNAVPPPMGESTPAPDCGIRVLCVSRLAPGKGVADLVEAFLRVPGADLSLVVAGDGALLDELRHLGAVDSRIRFAGWVDHLEKAALFRQSDVLVMPSHYEAMPYAVLEALSYGLAVVLSDAIELSDDVVVAGAGLIVRAGSVDGYDNALAELASNRDALLAMQHAARQLWREKYTEDQLRESLAAAWRRAIA
jgi:glycosyltransferase involved in cell wall biosynthesis